MTARNYLIYSRTDGKIVAEVFCTPDEIEANTPPGLFAIEGTASDPHNQRVDLAAVPPAIR